MMRPSSAKGQQGQHSARVCEVRSSKDGAEWEEHPTAEPGGGGDAEGNTCRQAGTCCCGSCVGAIMCQLQRMLAAECACHAYLCMLGNCQHCPELPGRTCQQLAGDSNVLELRLQPAQHHKKFHKCEERSLVCAALCAAVSNKPPLAQTHMQHAQGAKLRPSPRQDRTVSTGRAHTRQDS